MCQFKSALCLKDRVFVPDYDSHTDMLKELGIEDDYLGASKKFVRVELVPKDDDKTSDPMTWQLKVDQDITPEWFDIRADEQRIKKAVAEWAKAHILRDGEHEVKDGLWLAIGSATVNAYGSATVEAYDSATVKAYGSATVEAYDSATVKAYGSATVEAYDSATITAYDSATITAYGSATVTATDSATVKAYDSATITAYNSATVTATGGARVHAHNSATVEATGGATITATNSATVKAYSSATIEAYNSATVTALDSATVYATGSATVILPKLYQTDKPVTLEDEAICINHRDHTIRSKAKWTQEG